MRISGSTFARLARRRCRCASHLITKTAPLFELKITGHVLDRARYARFTCSCHDRLFLSSPRARPSSGSGGSGDCAAPIICPVVRLDFPLNTRKPAKRSLRTMSTSSFQYAASTRCVLCDFLYFNFIISKDLVTRNDGNCDRNYSSIARYSIRYRSECVSHTFLHVGHNDALVHFPAIAFGIRGNARLDGRNVTPIMRVSRRINLRVSTC